MLSMHYFLSLPCKTGIEYGFNEHIEEQNACINRMV